ncbi:MAG: DUF4922 domain-containing protein [Bacteroidetes bacterium]|nr:DUF4922 domain-containing protein [Bacteroidota bacterium]
MDTAGKTEILFNEQLRDWELAGINYGMLRSVKTRVLSFGGYRVLVQFNPGRIRSSAAKVDAKSIEDRPCFLCEKNRPAEQRGVVTDFGLTILVNPFPIFNRHLTIVSGDHIPQVISGHFTEMLSLARTLKNYVIFYNGPKCGASAPDHFHFQAGNLGFLPVEEDFELKASVKLLTVWAGTQIWMWRDYGRAIATLRGRDPESLHTVFGSFYARMKMLRNDKPEPMMNILAYESGNDYVVHLIPRRLHRPSQFFADGDGQVLLSPASVDLGGVLITPREEDFMKLTTELAGDIFSQVCLSEDQLEKLFDEFV